ncbi:hypothetical protein OMR07_06990 [Methylobacterium organophilum]|nr:hypothetical protein [Methylobacterium organophilum]
MQLRSVSSLDQAAILMLSMGDEISAGILRNFSREEIISISQAMARLSNVKQPMVSDVISRFFDDYKEQSSIKGASRSYLAGMLGKALGGDITRSLLDSIYGEEIRAKMAKMEWLDPKQFAALIAKEHAQMQAVFLAFLPPGMATEVLECMPAERQDELLYRIANLSEVNSDVIAELEQLIDRSLKVLSTQGSQVRGVKQAADIMNRFKGNRDQMFELLRARRSWMTYVRVGLRTPFQGALTIRTRRGVRRSPLSCPPSSPNCAAARPSRYRISCSDIRHASRMA